MLTSIQKVGLSILKYGFFYMWPLPVGWDLKKGCFFRKLTFFRLFFAGISHALSALLFLSCGYELAAYYFAGEGMMNVKLVTLAGAVCMMAGTGVALFISVGLMVYIGYFEMANSTLKFVDGMIDKYPPRHNGYTLLEKLIIPGPVTHSLTPWAGLTIIPLNMDPGYFVMDGYIKFTGDNVYEWTLEQIATGLAIRVIILLGNCEAARILGLVAATCGIFAYKVRKGMEIATSGKLSCQETIRIYRMGTIIHTFWSPILYPMASIILSCYFCGVVVLWWMVIKKFEEMPIHIYMGTAAFAVMLTIGLFLGLKLASRVGDTVEMVLDRCRVITGFRYAKASIGSKRWAARIMGREVRALRKIVVMYYPFLPIDRDFAINAMTGMVDGLLNALLIF